MQRGYVTCLALAVAGILAIASGCGGGDGGSGSTTRTIAGHTITVPTVSTPTTGTGGNGGTGSTSRYRLSPTITLPNGTRIPRTAMAPFRNCLTNHGVQAFQQTQLNKGRITQQQGAAFRARARAYVACAPQLPAPLHRAFEQYMRQLRERQQGQ